MKNVQDIILSSIHDTLNPIAWVIGLMALIMWVIVLVNIIPDIVVMLTP